jgi:hypothetical protein
MSTSVLNYWNYLDSLDERVRNSIHGSSSASIVADVQSMMSEILSSGTTLEDKSLAVGIVLLALADEMSSSIRYKTGFTIVKSGLHFRQAFNISSGSGLAFCFSDVKAKSKT